MQELLNKAIEIAKIAHEGQTDKAGSPYIGHPLRIMDRLETESEKIVGVLHDAVEDSDLTLEDLTKAGQRLRAERPLGRTRRLCLGSNRIVAAVDAITKRDGEESEIYLQRVMDNPIALKVKIADMTDNMDLSRITNVTEKDRARIRNYQKNIVTLKNKLAQG